MDPSPYHSLIISAEKIISQWDVDESNHTDLIFLWSDRREEIPPYLHATDDLHDLIQTLSQISSSSSSESSSPPLPKPSAPSPSPSNYHFDVSSSSSSSFDYNHVTKHRQNDAASITLLDHAQNLMQTAMFRLEAEFRHLLTNHSKPCTDPEAMSDFLASSARSGHPRSSFGDLAMDGFDSFVDRTNTGNGAPHLHAKTGHGDGDEEEKQESMATKTTDDEVPSSSSAFPLSDAVFFSEAMIPSDIAADLSDMATRMLRSGYGKELAHIYVPVRRLTLEESMHQTVLQGSILLSAEERGLAMFEAVQRMPWQDLQAEIVAWISAMKVAVGLFFPAEKRLCHYIFGDSSSSASSSSSSSSSSSGQAPYLSAYCCYESFRIDQHRRACHQRHGWIDYYSYGSDEWSDNQNYEQ